MKISGKYLETSNRWLTKKQKQSLNAELKTAKEYIERNIPWKY